MYLSLFFPTQSRVTSTPKPGLQPPQAMSEKPKVKKCVSIFACLIPQNKFYDDLRPYSESSLYAESNKPGLSSPRSSVQKLLRVEDFSVFLPFDPLPTSIMSILWHIWIPLFKASLMVPRLLQKLFWFRSYVKLKIFSF